MSFSQIIGHQKQIETLRAAVANQRLHHAYLFLGPEGVGKRTIAIALAKLVHCSEGHHDFCGQCANCARITAGHHPDVHFIEPLAGKKEISIQQIREIEKDLNFRAFSRGRKIAIIDPATQMNLSAQNALLKTLEEPPQDSLLILIAGNGGALLPTLRSRCLSISFAPLPRQVLSRFLMEDKGMNAEAADLLASMALGSVRAASEIDSEALRERRRNWIDLLAGIGLNGYRTAMEAAEVLAANKDEAQAFLKWAETWYRDVLVYNVTQAADDLVNRDMLMPIRELSAGANAQHITSWINEIVETNRSIQRNLNRRMVLERLFLNLAEAH